MNNTENCEFLCVSLLCGNQAIVEQLHSLPEFYSKYKESRKAATCKQSLLENISNY